MCAIAEEEVKKKAIESELERLDLRVLSEFA